MRWRKRRPTRAGWYWMRRSPRSHPRCVDVVRWANGETAICMLPALLEYRPLPEGAEWAGPIPEPEEPSP